MTENAPPTTETPAPATKCRALPSADNVPGIPEREPCITHCECPDTNGKPPTSCLDDLIRSQGVVVKKAERAKAFVDELTAIQGKVTSAQSDYTQRRFLDLKQEWLEQDKAINDLIRKVVCAVHCWKCLLECRLCKQLTEIRTLEERLNGPGDLVTDMGLPTAVSSLFDLRHWHERNVANMQARLDRINLVLTAWEKPSDTLGDVLEKNDKLIEDTQKVVATDPVKAVYDIFMTLVPRHWAIRPRNDDVKSQIDPKYVRICECKNDPAPEPAPDKPATEGYGTNQDTANRKIEDKDPNRNENPDPKPDDKKCKCDEGTPDECCGPDVGILNLRQRLIGPLPYIVEPKAFPEIICCLTTERLTPASDLLAEAQAQLAATSAEIEQVTKSIDDKKNSIESAFVAGLPTPFDCEPYESTDDKPPTQSLPDGNQSPDPVQNDPKAQAR
jgi:hypothetical protein